MAYHYANLNAEKALIWRIVHLNNIPWILGNGLHCKNSANRDPDYVQIGNAELIDRRSRRNVPVAPAGVLADYVPFYFTPFSPMLYNIHTGRGGVAKYDNQDICILVSSIPRVTNAGLHFVFTDRHAYSPLAKYFNEAARLKDIDWPLIQSRNFARSTDDPERTERYQAEALIYQHVPIACLAGIVCFTPAVESELNAMIRAAGADLDVKVRPEWYF